MDFEDLGANLPFIIGIIALIFLQFFLARRRKPATTQREIVESFLSEIRLNQALAETVGLRPKPRKFAASSWRINKTKLDFLDQPLQFALSDAFTIVEDFNRQIEAAKKYKSTIYMASLNADKLKKPLAKSQEGLEKWLLENTGEKEPSSKYSGMFDSLFGRR